MHGFLLFNKLPLKLLDDQIPYIKAQFEMERSIKQNCHLNPKNAKQMSQNYIAPSMRQKIKQILENNFFALIADEYTNISNDYLLGLTVRTQISKKITNLFYDLIKIEGSANHQNVFKIINEVLTNPKIKNNLIPFGSDGAQVFRGSNNLVIKLLKAEKPHLWDIHCVAHCSHLMANATATAFQNKFFSDLNSLIAFLIKAPPKIQSEYEVMLNNMKIKSKRFKRNTKIRWLSLQTSIE